MLSKPLQVLILAISATVIAQLPAFPYPITIELTDGKLVVQDTENLQLENYVKRGKHKTYYYYSFADECTYQISEKIKDVKDARPFKDKHPVICQLAAMSVGSLSYVTGLGAFR